MVIGFIAFVLCFPTDLLLEAQAFAIRQSNLPLPIQGAMLSSLVQPGMNESKLDLIFGKECRMSGVALGLGGGVITYHDYGVEIETTWFRVLRVKFIE